MGGRPLRIAATIFAVTAVFLAARRAWSADRIPVAEPIVVTQAYIERADTLRRNETLSHLFARHNIVGREMLELLAAADGIDPRRVRAGQVFQFRYVIGEELPRRVTVRIGDEKHLSINREPDGAWHGLATRIDWISEVRQASGKIASSLYETLDGLISDSILSPGERARLAWDVADGVFGWVVDFARDIYPGDQVDLLFEREVSSLGDIRFGRILAVHLQTRRVRNTAYLLPGANGSLAYFDEDGKSLRRAFMRRPVAFRRISSGFSGRRFHPVLKRYRAHAGVDYAADAGTPIWSTADGTVTRAGRWGSYGIMVEIRHAYGVRTRYAHMSRLAKAVRPGMRVRQEQVIGYSGATGLANGPHVHYEFIRNGRHVDPRTAVRYGTAQPVPQNRHDEFESLRANYLSLLFPSGAPAITASNDD